MKPVCIHGQRPAPNALIHVYLNVPAGYEDGIYYRPQKKLNELSVTKGNLIIHKKFRTLHEAEVFYFSNRPDAYCPLKKHDKQKAIAFTDGSFSPKENKFSYGAYISHGNNEYEICGKLSCPDKKFRNIAGEVEAVRQALSFCKSRDISSVEIRHDFDQIGEWARKGGKTELAKVFHEFVNGLVRSGMKIEFSKVKAHSGNTDNNRADRLSRALWNGA